MSNFRRTQELRQNRDTPSKSMSKASRMGASTMGKKKVEREVPPEDNWNAAGNPSVYFDELP